MSFELDPHLSGDSLPLGDLPLCRVLLMDDATYPWLILVPRRAGLAEIIDLDEPERMQLMAEIAQASTVLKGLFAPQKLNIGALGNIVRQLHVHVLARFENDPAWPGPVWGKAPRIAYARPDAGALTARLHAAFGAALSPIG